MMVSGPGEDGSVFPNFVQDVSNLVINGDYILKKKKDTKGSRAWQQVFNLWIMKKCLESCVAVCIKCAYFIQRKWEEKKDLRVQKYVRSFEAMLAGSYKCLCLFIQPGHIRIKSRSDPDCNPGWWVIRVSSTDLVSTLMGTDKTEAS